MKVWKSVLLAVGASLLVTSPVSAAERAPSDSRTEVVPGSMVHIYDYQKGTNNVCVVYTFARWADVPVTTEATATYEYNGQPLSDSGTAPFDDRIDALPASTYVPSGHHQLYVSHASAMVSPGTNCAEVASLQQSRAAYTNPVASVKLTIAKTAQCLKAEKSLKKKKQKVADLQEALRKAKSEKAKSEIRAKLEKAKKQKKKAAKKVRKNC